MSNTQELKEYLIGDGGFLLNEIHNGKTIMLSGAWGSGKTHFWQNEIERKQEQINGKDKFTEKEYQEGLYYRLNQKNKACIYVSLYGKESISEIKYEIFREAYNSLVDEDIISKSASFFSSISPSFGGKSLTEGFEKFNQKAKDKKSKEILQDGSIICLDDFERKSKKIDLNDLFGLISHLAVEHNCKMVIILNSDVFEGEEKNIFKMVKEKTVNKFFYFKPSIEELFYLIANDEKYTPLETYKTDILKAIIETEEVNARIYIQVLDNCLEWISKGYDNTYFRVVVLSTVNFVLNDVILGYPYETTVPSESLSGIDILFYEENMNEYPRNLLRGFDQDYNLSETEFVYRLLHDMLDNEKIGGLKEEEYRAWIKLNEDKLKAIWKYGYRLAFAKDIDKKIYYEIVNFVKSGILPKRDEVEV